MNSNSKSPFPGVFGFGPGTELNLHIVGSHVLMSAADPPVGGGLFGAHHPAPPNSVGFGLGKKMHLVIIV